MIPKVKYGDFRSQKMFLENRPMVLTDALSDWHFGERWTPDAVTSAVGHREVPVRVCKGTLFAPAISDDPVYEKMNFGTVSKKIREVGDGDCYYVMAVQIADKLPELMGNLVVPDWIPTAHKRDISFWFGRKTVSPLHFDGNNNFFAQVFGAKKFLVYPPGDSHCLYPADNLKQVYAQPPIGLCSSDLERFHMVANASPSEVTVNEGEVFFLPAFWWHYVTAADVAISVSIFGGVRFEQVAEAPNALRELFVGYRHDGLARFKVQWLKPNGLDFLAAAEQMLNRGFIWASCALTLAAFDEVAETGVCGLPSMSQNLDSVPVHLRDLELVRTRYPAVSIFSYYQRILTDALSSRDPAHTHAGAQVNVSDVMRMIQRLREAQENDSAPLYLTTHRLSGDTIPS